MSSYISDCSDTGQRMHVICDGCHTEVVMSMREAGIDTSPTCDELADWRRGAGLRDLCAVCARLDVAPARR